MRFTEPVGSAQTKKPDIWRGHPVHTLNCDSRIGTAGGNMTSNTLIKTSITIALAAAMSACAPEVGSEAWCEDLAEKPKGDWSVNEAAEFAKSCVFKNYNDNK